MPLLCAHPSWAVTIPGSADINRIGAAQLKREQPSFSKNKDVIQIPYIPLTGPLPPGAGKIHFQLGGVWFHNVTVFDDAELKSLYRLKFRKIVDLKFPWEVAAELTKMYRDKGYFLCRAYVPAQKIGKSGILRIEAIEGSIGSITFEGARVPNSPIITKAVAAILTDKPTRIQTLETQLLLLNNLPGLSFKATLAPASQNQTDVELILTVTKIKPVRTVSVDNHGSRFMGPNEITASWEGSLLPLQKTKISYETTPNMNGPGHFYSINLTHKIALSTRLSLDLGYGHSNALPAYTLKQFNITSQSNSASIGLDYRLIRTRRENLTSHFALNYLNSSINLLNTPFNRDRIRTAQLGVDFNNADKWHGQNFLDMQITHGLPILSSTKTDDKLVSKPDVHPDFTKITLHYMRLQYLAKDWSSLLSLDGQAASGSLYSSEEFGYGGSVVGRAYNVSEITGDEGVSASLELHYSGLPVWYRTIFSPYAFYDIGRVWQLHPSTPPSISAASAGLGLDVKNALGLNANIYVAKPLTKAVLTPLYGTNGKAPSYSFLLGYNF